MLVDIQKMHKKILITGGGSGGHLSSAKSIIETLIEDENYPTNQILYIGGDLGMEGEKIGNSIEQREFKDVPFKTYFIRAGKLQRKISLNTLKLLLRTALGFFDSLSILLKEKPDLVISTGGFVSVPVCKVAWLMRKPIYLHEQTASVGLANKVVGMFAKKIFVSFKDSIKQFPKGKAIHVGNNVRKAIFKKEATEKTDKRIVEIVANKKDYPLIYISGGSLGSHALNQKVIVSLEALLEKYSVILQTGDNRLFKEYELAVDLYNSLPKDKQNKFYPTKYLDENNIGYVLNNMDIFVGRSGANTVYEIGVLKKNALFIPIPWVTHNEQYLNANILQELGTSKILEEKYLSDTDLVEEIDRFREQIKLRDIDYNELEKFFPVNAASRIVKDILLSRTLL
jgi:UDP-N-acetylglucosamine--N-acetylmuramyl-(pentapeptide) pyrophosphoryl-undecaprenol N-acetylglucosamine transferase